MNKVVSYNKHIGQYIFAAIAALALIVKIESGDSIIFVTVFLAVLYGIAAWGIVGSIWFGVEDFLVPYIYGTEESEVEEVDDSQLQENPIEMFETNLNRRINGNKFWARGAVILTEDEEVDLRRYFGERWRSNGSSRIVPSYINGELRRKLEDRGIVNDINLTEYGEKVIPSKFSNLANPVE